MLSLVRLKTLNGPVCVSSEALNVAPSLIGVPLAKPTRRALALALDGVVIGLLSSINALWPVAGAAMIIWRLRKSASPLSERQRKRLVMALAVLVLIAVVQIIAPTPKKANAASDGMEFVALKEQSDAPESVTQITQKIEKELNVQRQLGKRVAELEHQLKLAQQSKAKTWVEEIKTLARSNGLDFGWAIAYFTLLPFWWQGQTVGKRVLRLRIVELTGRPLTLMHAFSRYGGYAAGMATGGVGFIQVLWDHNRQAIQDKIAHTVVIDTRGPHAHGAFQVTPSEIETAADSREAGGVTKGFWSPMRLP